MYIRQSPAEEQQRQAASQAAWANTWSTYNAIAAAAAQTTTYSLNYGDPPLVRREPNANRPGDFQRVVRRPVTNLEGYVVSDGVVDEDGDIPF